MLQKLSLFLPSVILSIMLFFSFVIAPITFSSLDEINARKFIRKIFPYYYNINLVISLILLITLFFLNSFKLDFFLVLIVSILFFLSNYLLMPLINKYRDNNVEKKFKLFHLVSVIINFLQIIILILILFL